MKSTVLQFVDEEQAATLVGAEKANKVKVAVDAMIAKHGKRCVVVTCTILEQQQLAAFIAEHSPELRQVVDKLMEATAEIVSACGAPKADLTDCITTLRPLFIEVRDAINRKFDQQAVPVVRSKLHKGES